MCKITTLENPAGENTEFSAEEGGCNPPPLPWHQHMILHIFPKTAKHEIVNYALRTLRNLKTRMTGQILGPWHLNFFD